MLEQMDRVSQGSERRVPLHLITGFLGSGKTTLLRSLLAIGTERIAVLVNEVGELALDHHLLERIDDDVFALPGGCLCCAVRDELHAALDRIIALAPARIVLEASGIADPAPLLHRIGADVALANRLRLAGVIAVVDCLRAEQLVSVHPEVRRQLDFADRIVLTKTDLAPERVDGLRAWLEAEAPGREVRVFPEGQVDPAWLLASPGFARGTVHDARDWLHDARAAPYRTDDAAAAHLPFTTHAVHRSEPVDIDALQLWLRLVGQLDGDRMLRVKMLARCAKTGAGFVLQSAGRSMSPPQRLGAPPSALTGAEVVIVERGMEPGVRSRLLASLDGALDAGRGSHAARD